MKYKIKFERRAFQELNKLDQVISRRLLKNVRELEQGIISKDVKRLKGMDMYRLRIGDYRVLFGIEGELIKIIKVGHRKNVYKR